MPQTRQQTRLIEAIKPVLQEHGVVRAELIGSYAYGDHSPDSDVDILVELPEGLSLFDFIGIQQQLEDKLDREVDLIQYGSIKPALQDNILNGKRVTII